MSTETIEGSAEQDNRISTGATTTIELDSKTDNKLKDEPSRSSETEQAVRLALRYFYLHHHSPRPDFSEWREDCEQIAWLTALEAEDTYSSQPQQLNEDSNIHRLIYLQSKILVALKREWRQEIRWRQRVTCCPESDNVEMKFSDQQAEKDILSTEVHVDFEYFLRELKNRLDELDWFIIQQMANGNTQNEIANSLGITQSAVCQRLTKIRNIAMDIAAKLSDL